MNKIMPELPEVQTIIDDLQREGLVGQVIQYVHVYWANTVSTPDLSIFRHILVEKQIQGISRRGKYLIFHLSEDYDLLVHLRMTGHLLLVSEKTPLSPYVRLVLELKNHHQQLLFHDTRKFGRWYLVHRSHTLFEKMGPEPLSSSFSSDSFLSSLKNRQRALKPLLLDQTFIAGLGNIYVDEALWEAQLHPLQPANTLTDKEAQNLYHAIQRVLKRGIASQGTTLGTGRANFYRLNGKQGGHQLLLNVFRRTGKPCHRCGHLIERLMVTQRSTHICPSCQKRDMRSFTKLKNNEPN